MRLSTPRLLLRAWTATDLPALSALNADPEVNVWLGGEGVAHRSAEALETMQSRLELQGWGVLAVCSLGGELLGLAGLQPLSPVLPVAPGVEAVWRLKRAAWGRGYVREAMQAILTGLPSTSVQGELLALVAKPNLRSAATALSLGFRYDPTADFLHPALDPDHPLRLHGVYRRPLQAPG